MGGSEQIYEEKVLKNKSNGNDGQQQDQWAIMEGGINGGSDDSMSNDSPFEESMDSTVSSSSSSDMMEDSNSSSSPSYGPLYQLSELVAQLPIKRGLSKYYQGKSQTFASLESVKSLEDLAKKWRSPCCKRRKIKSSKSHGGGLDNQIPSSPRATISKTKKTTSRVFLRGVIIRWFRSI